MNEDDMPEAIGIPIPAHLIPPELRSLLDAALEEMHRHHHEDENHREPTLGEITFLLDDSIEQQRSEPRLVLAQRRIGLMEDMVTSDLDETLSRIHTLLEHTSTFPAEMVEKIAFVESIRGGLKHPDELIRLWKTDQWLGDYFTVFLTGLQDLLQNWKHHPLWNHGQEPRGD